MRGKAIADHLLTLANVGFVTVQERSLGTLHVAQAHALGSEVVGANFRRRVVDGAQRQAGVVQAKERDHVVLIDAVAGDAYSADESSAAVDGNAAGENLNAVGQAELV